MQTQNIHLNLLHNHQIHKEILINENSFLVDAMLFNSVKSINHKEPPLSSENGDKYIITNDSKGDWSNVSNSIAIKNQNKWNFISLKEGMTFWIVNEKRFVVFSDEKFHTSYKI